MIRCVSVHLSSNYGAASMSRFGPGSEFFFLGSGPGPKDFFFGPGSIFIFNQIRFDFSLQSKYSGGWKGVGMGVCRINITPTPSRFT